MDWRGWRARLDARSRSLVCCRRDSENCGVRNRIRNPQCLRPRRAAPSDWLPAGSRAAIAPVSAIVRLSVGWRGCVAFKLLTKGCWRRYSILVTGIRAITIKVPSSPASPDRPTHSDLAKPFLGVPVRDLCDNGHFVLPCRRSGALDGSVQAPGHQPLQSWVQCRWSIRRQDFRFVRR